MLSITLSCKSTEVSSDHCHKVNFSEFKVNDSQVLWPITSFNGVLLQVNVNKPRIILVPKN